MKTTNYVLWIKQVVGNMRANIPTGHVRTFFDTLGRWMKVGDDGVARTVVGDTPAEFEEVAFGDVVLDATYNGKLVVITSDDPTEVLTVDGLPEGFNVGFIRRGTGTVEFVEGGAGAINSVGGLLSMGDQHSTATLILLPDGSFNLSGALA